MDENRVSHCVGSRRPRDRQQGRIQRFFVAGRADADRFEVPAIRAVVSAGQLHEDAAAFLERNAALRHGHLAQDHGRRVLRQDACLVEHGGLHLAQRAERGDADLRVGVGEQAFDFADAGRTEPRQQPDRARAMIGVRIGEDPLHGGQRPGPLRREALEAAAAHVDGRAEQRLDLTRRRAQIDRRRRQPPALRRDPVDAAVALAVLHLVPADDRIVPVGHVDRAVGADRDVARPEPLPAILVDLVPDVVLVRRGEARQEVEALEREPGAARLRQKAEDHVPARIRAQEQATVALAEQVALVAHDAGRGAGAGVVAGRQHAGILLVPVRRERVLSGPAIGLPEPRAVGAEVAGVRAFHQPGRPARHHLIVVVVLPEIAERVDGQLVGVAEVVGHHRQARAVRLDAQGQPSRPHPPVVAHHPALILLVVGRAAGIEAARAQRPSRSVGDDVRAGVAGVEVPASVGSGDDARAGRGRDRSRRTRSAGSLSCPGRRLRSRRCRRSDGATPTRPRACRSPRGPSGARRSLSCTNTFDASARPSPSVSVRMRIRSPAGWVSGPCFAVLKSR